MKGNRTKLRLSFNSPAILVFTAICIGVQLLDLATGGRSNGILFSVYRSSLRDPLTYIRCITHVFGHSGWEHLVNNIMYILILGPMLEEKYGTQNIIFVMLATALVIGIINPILFPNVRLLGASGIVFAFIVLSSITVRENGQIPVTFILVVLLYLGQQIYEGLSATDNVSQIAHIIGGIVGAILGFVMNSLSMKNRRNY